MVEVNNQSEGQQEQPIDGIIKMFDEVVKDTKEQHFCKLLNQEQEKYAAAQAHQEPTEEEIDALIEEMPKIQAQEKRERVNNFIKKIIRYSDPQSELSKVGISLLRLLGQIEKGDITVYTELDTVFIEFQQLLRAEIKKVGEVPEAPAKQKTKQINIKIRNRKVSSELTKKETEAYQLVRVSGKTLKQAAIEMQCSPQNVSKLLKKAEAKVKAQSSRSVNLDKAQPLSKDRRGQENISEDDTL